MDSDLLDRCPPLAQRLVSAGRLVPGLTVDGSGRGRSWWWPLPAADDRAVIAHLLAGQSDAAHRSVASTLQEMVDLEARRRLVAAGVRLVAPRRGRRGVTEAWLGSLAQEDPWLPTSLPAVELTALAAQVATWVRSGLPAAGPSRLCLRVHEPEDGTDPWRVELLLQATGDPSLILPGDVVWAGAEHLPVLDGGDPIEQLLTGLGHAVRVAPELEPLLDQARPAELELDSAAVLAMIAERAGPLADAGIGLLLPTWWTRRGRLALRAKARSRTRTATGGATTGGVGMDAIVDFQWEAAIGDDRLTARELASLEAAAVAKQHLVQVRGRWVEIRPEELKAVIGAAGQRGQARVGELLRAGMGLDDLGAPDGVEVVGVRATGWLADLLDGALHARVAPIVTPAGFDGQLRPYQERGVGWLAFLGRLGLGACLADDMGLGKTAQPWPPSSPSLSRGRPWWSARCPCSAAGSGKPSASRLT